MASTGISTTRPIPRWRGLLGSNLIVVVIRLLSIAAGLAYVKAYTRALSNEEVGAFFYLGTLSYALNALIFVPVDFYMQARIATMSDLPVAGVRALAIKVLLIGMATACVISAPLIYAGKLHIADLPALYAVASLLYLCTSMRGLLNNRGNPIFVSAMLLLESIGRLAAFLLTALAFGASARILMVSSAMALTVELAVIIAQVRRRLALSYALKSLDPPGAILRAAAPIAGAALCNVMQLQCYRVVYPLAGLGAASGTYGVVSNIGAAAMSACGSIFSQIHVPRLYRSRGASIGRFVGMATLLAGVVLVAAMSFAPFLVNLLTKQQYVPYALAVGFGVVTEACNLIIGGYAVLLTLEQRAGTLLKFNLAAAVLSVGGCLAALALRPEEPFLIGITIVGSQLLMTFSMLAFATKRGPKTS
jgi:O-antigen/teichoic acid export membrane protein